MNLEAPFAVARLARLARLAPLAPLVRVALIASALTTACSVATVEPGESAAAADTASTPSAYPVVQVTPANWMGPIVNMPGTGTLISDSWVLTSNYFIGSNPGSVTVCTPTSPAVCESTTTIYRGTVGYYGALLHLPAPLTHLPSYPTLSTSALTSGETMICADGSSGAPTQEAYDVTGPSNAGDGIFLEAPVAGSWLASNGLGCFVGNTLVGLQGKASSVEDVSVLRPWIQQTLCGGATCGSVRDGQNEIACGTCDDGYTCKSGSCVEIPIHCGNGWVDCGGYCARWVWAC